MQAYTAHGTPTYRMLLHVIMFFWCFIVVAVQDEEECDTVVMPNRID